VRFYRGHRELFREAKVIADVGVLRSFPSQVYAEPKWAELTGRTEQSLIEHRVPFQIIYDQQLRDLHRYKALVLAGCVALSEPQIKRLKDYVASGGRLCILGPVATHDEWLRPRAKPVLEDLPSARVVQLSEHENCVSALERLCGGQLTLSIAAAAGLCAELTEQVGRRLVHVVNYRADAPCTNTTVTVRLPPGTKGHAVRLVSPEHADSTELLFDQGSHGISFAIPRVNVYEIAIVEFRQEARSPPGFCSARRCSSSPTVIEYTTLRRLIPPGLQLTN
jgi:hypothetical protein